MTCPKWLNSVLWIERRGQAVVRLNTPLTSWTTHSLVGPDGLDSQAVAPYRDVGQEAYWGHHLLALWPVALLAGLWLRIHVRRQLRRLREANATG